MTSAVRTQLLYKVVVTGDLGTGKTQLLKQYVHQIYSHHYSATIGVDFALKVLHRGNKTISLQLWDISGHELYGSMTRTYYENAVGAFVVFDVTRPSTFESVSMWKSDLDKKVRLPNGKRIPAVLLANKCDSDASKRFTDDFSHLDDYCKEKGFVGWFETSAKENIGIDEAARCLVTKILENDDSIEPEYKEMLLIDSRIPFTIGSMVSTKRGPLYGIVRWIGTFPVFPADTIAGVELERPLTGCTDGTWGGRRFFNCPPGRAFFCPVKFLEYTREKNKTALERGMEEGHVLLTNKKIVLCGPPCVGKTAFKSLLFNWPAPKHHNSTAIASRPVQAIERIANQMEGKIWDVVKVEDLFQMLSDAILNTDETEAKSHTVSTSSSSPSDPPQSSAIVSSATGESTASLPPSASQVDSPQSGSQSVSADQPQPAKDTDYYSKEILQYLSTAQSKEEDSRELHKATWIHLLDSGGQPQFTDMLRMFLRGNSLYVFVMKMTDSLHDKPMFRYSLNGKLLHAPKEMKMTNLQIIENFVRSVAALKNSVIKVGDKEIVCKPAFAVIATHSDQSGGLKKLFGQESLKEKNAQLFSCLKEFLDLFVFYDRSSDSMIFPVDNLCRWNRKKISADIRQHLLSRKDLGFNVPIPVRWYMFEIKLKEEASKESHGMISLDSCYTVGTKLGMTRSDVDQCLVFLDSFSMCIHYCNLLPKVIFTNIQYLLDTLSNIVRVSFVDDLEAILPEGVSLSADTQELLKKDGIFEESLLDSLGLTFVPSLFTKPDLLQLLHHLLVISPINTGSSLYRYFMPIVLPTDQLNRDERKAFSKSVDPLIITFNSKLVLQGLFPTLVVSLLSRMEEPRFYIDSRSPSFTNQLRYTVKLFSEYLFGSVLLCDDYKSIEVYFTGLPQHCYILRQVILQALTDSAEMLAYDAGILQFSAVPCCLRKHACPATDKISHPITVSYRMNPPVIRCSVETDLPSVQLIDERQRCWLIEPVSSTVSVSEVLPNGILNEGHASIVLSAISDLVDEWETLGIHLGLKYAVLQEIRQNCFHQVQPCRTKMIMKWLQQDTPTTQDLISALKKLERGDIVSKVQQLIN